MTLADAILIAIPCADGVPMRTADVVLAVRSAAPEHDGVTEARVFQALAYLAFTADGRACCVDEGALDEPSEWTWARTAKGDAHPAVVARRKAMEEAR